MKPFILWILRLLGREWCKYQGASVHPSAIIHGFPRIIIKQGGSIHIHQGVTINAAAWSNAHNDGRRTVLYAGKDAHIHLHPYSGISSCRIIAYDRVEIGCYSLIGAGSLICDSDMHEIPLRSSLPVSIYPIHIGENVFIGANTTILKKVYIGNDSVIGASSVVTRSIPSAVVAAGNPAQIIRSLVIDNAPTNHESFNKAFT